MATKDPVANLRSKPMDGIFTRGAKFTMNAFHKSPTVKFIKNRFKPKVFNEATVNKFVKSAKSPLRMITRTVGRGTMGLGIGLGVTAMLSVGLMKGMVNSSQQIVAERQMQDQRYARNITMMSRLGYTTGTSSMNKYNHTTGLSLALSSNRHGRGGY